MASDPLAATTTRLAPLAAEPGQPVVQHQVSRVLILDDAGRAYLVYGRDPNGPDEPHWFAIGGRIADGETPREAACRKLATDVAISVTPDTFDQPSWCSTSRLSSAGVTYRHYQRFFDLRVSAELLPVEPTELARAHGAHTYGWWSAVELEHTDEPYCPPELPELLRKLAEPAP